MNPAPTVGMACTDSDMIGTLVVILPSDFTGGAMVLEHQNEKFACRGSSTVR